MMSQIIIYISIILWLLPLIKNFRKEYFLFFLGIAIQDPGNILFFYVFKFDPNYWGMFCQLFIICTFRQSNRKIKRLDPFIIGIVVVLVIISFPSNLIFLILNIVILVKVTVNIIEELKNRGYLNGFIVMISFYLLNLVLKTLFVSTQSLHRETYYIYSSISMFAFALFFTFTNEKTKFLQINIKKYLVRANDNKNYRSR